MIAEGFLLTTTGPWYFRNFVVEYVVKIADDKIHADPTTFALLASDDKALGDEVNISVLAADGSMNVLWSDL